MRRRTILAMLGGWALVQPWTARAQSSGERPRLVGIAFGGDSGEGTDRIEALRQSLRERGWREGENLKTVFRLGAGNAAAMATAMKELIALQPDLLFLSGSLALLAAREQKAAMPIVFSNVIEPVERGLVASLAHPGGNATGIASVPAATMAPKLAEILKQIAPGLRRVAVLGNRDLPNFATWLKAVEAAAPGLGLEAIAVPVHDVTEIEAKLAALAGERDIGVAIGQDAFMNGLTPRIAELCLTLRLPSISPFDGAPRAGGLVSYGVDLLDVNRRAAPYVDKILRGAKPADLPVEYPDRYQLVVNAKTAQALGLAVPPALLARADEVIE